MNHHSPVPAVVAVFPQEDSLPRTECHPSVEDRNRQRGGCQRSFDMRRHVVRTLGGVSVERVVFRYQAVEPPFEIAARRRVGILLDRQAGRCVLEKQGAQTLPDAARRYGVVDLVGEFMKTLARDVKF